MKKNNYLEKLKQLKKEQEAWKKASIDLQLRQEEERGRFIERVNEIREERRSRQEEEEGERGASRPLPGGTISISTTNPFPDSDPESDSDDNAITSKQKTKLCHSSYEKLWKHRRDQAKLPIEK